MGLLEKFDGGTLFLDEVEILPLQTQQVLLLPLENRPFNPAAGEGEPKRVNVRFIFASNEPLEDEIKKGRLRSDLYRRIAARGTIILPSLKRRKEDIPTLANLFLNLWNKEQNKSIQFEPDIYDLLTVFDYEKFNSSELKTKVVIAADAANFEGSKTIKDHHLKGKITTLPKNKIESPLEIAFDDEEMKELSTLRNNSFNISMAEEELGYSKGAKTLSNHFRGIFYKTFKHFLLKNNDENEAINQSVKLFMTDSDEGGLEEKIEAKLRRFVIRLKERVKAPDLLFNNLPKKYHDDLRHLLEVFKY
jgi:DNA-binding NtrC family response regulator